MPKHLRRTSIAALALLPALALAACGDEEEPDAEPSESATSESTPTTSEAPTTESPTEPESSEASAGGFEISLVDAKGEVARQALVAADDVPDGDLFFANQDDIDCTAPGEDTTNLNARAAEWSCTVEAERNGVRCEGTIVAYGQEGVNPDGLYEDVAVRDSTLACEPA